MRWISLFGLATVFLIAGCDTAGDGPPPVPMEDPPAPVEDPPVGDPVDPPVDEDPVDPPSVRLTEPFSDIAFAFQTTIDPAAVKVIALSEHFAVESPSDSSVVLAYEATVEGVVAVDLDGSLLRVRPVDVGEGAVIVRARAGESAVVADTFAVEVSTECPSGPSSGEADFLPLVEGETWRFRYTGGGYSGSQNFRDEGTLTLALGAMSCVDGTRTIEAEEHKEGVRTSWYSNGTSGPPVPFEADRTLNVVETATGVRVPWSSLTVARYHAVSTDTVRVESNSGLLKVTLVPGALLEYHSFGVPHTSYRYSYSLRRLSQGP